MQTIRIGAGGARVEVTTRATGQAEVPAVLELRRERGEWRVEGLGE